MMPAICTKLLAILLLLAKALTVSSSTGQIRQHRLTSPGDSLPTARTRNPLLRVIRRSRKQLLLLDQIRGGHNNHSERTTISSGKVFVASDSNLPANISARAIPAFAGSSSVLKAEELTTTIPSPPTSSKKKDKKSSLIVKSGRLADIRRRMVPVVLLLGGFLAISYFLQEDGLILLTVVLQMGMYSEATKVIGGILSSRWNAWWWFTTVALAVNGPRMVPWQTPMIAAISYGMIVLGIIINILHLNLHRATPEHFREYLREAAVCHLAMVRCKTKKSSNVTGTADESEC